MSNFDGTAADQDFAFDQGDDETFAITREDSDGNAKDISGYTFWLTIKSNRSDSDANAVVQNKVTSHTDAANGQTEIDLTNSDTNSLAGNYHYDIQEKTDGGSVNTLVQGTMYFRTDVTNSTS